MTNRICSVDGCERPHGSRGLCRGHAQRLRRGHALTDKPLERPPVPECSIDGCSSMAHARGWCDKHWKHWREHGDPLGGTFRSGDIAARFWSHVEKTEACWNWTGSTRTNRGGNRYGKFRLSREDGSAMAHRFAFELINGAIPTGMVVDHTCHNTMCVRPDHLRAVTKKQNSEHRAGPMTGTASGVRGVSKHRDKWMAGVTHNGRAMNLGTFDSIEEAAAASRTKRNELFTHNDKDRTEVA